MPVPSSPRFNNHQSHKWSGLIFLFHLWTFIPIFAIRLHGLVSEKGPERELWSLEKESLKFSHLSCFTLIRFPKYLLGHQEIKLMRQILQMQRLSHQSGRERNWMLMLATVNSNYYYCTSSTITQLLLKKGMSSNRRDGVCKGFLQIHFQLWFRFFPKSQRSHRQRAEMMLNLPSLVFVLINRL